MNSAPSRAPTTTEPTRNAASREGASDAALQHVGASTVTAVGQRAQLTIEDAIAAGERGAGLALEAATRADPDFKAKAQAAIVRHLAACPRNECDGETLVDVARAHGAVPNDDRAFGGVFQGLQRRGVIRCLRSDLPRKRGHGTSGGKLWALCQ